MVNQRGRTDKTARAEHARTFSAHPGQVARHRTARTPRLVAPLLSPGSVRSGRGARRPPRGSPPTAAAVSPPGVGGGDQAAQCRPMAEQLPAAYGSTWYARADLFDDRTMNGFKGTWRNFTMPSVPGTGKPAPRTLRAIPAGKIVAESTCGCWVSLLDKGGTRGVGPYRTNVDYDSTLWRKALRKASPNSGGHGVHHRQSRPLPARSHRSPRAADRRRASSGAERPSPPHPPARPS